MECFMNTVSQSDVNVYKDILSQKLNSSKIKFFFLKTKQKE